VVDETSIEHKREYLTVVGVFAVVVMVWCFSYMRINGISLSTDHDHRDHSKHDH
jgi:hypothetical protein